MSDPHSSSARAASQAGEAAWDVIAERIDAFAVAWDQSLAGDAGPPPLEPYLDGLDPATAGQLLIELIKLDLERRWEHNQQPQHIEWYVSQLPQLRRIDQLPTDLLYEELQARMAAGLPIYQEEVRQRFPGQADSLLRLLGGMAISGSPTATYFADTVVEHKKQPAPAAKSRTAPFAALKPGDQLDDFQLLTPLGSGAFARVFLARQVSMERLVALKISAPTGSEPQTLAQLDHGNIVRVFDQRSSAEPPARLLYMEVVSGGTLHDVITRARNSYDGKPSGQLLLKAIDERLSAVGTPIPESSSSRGWMEDATWPEVVCQLGCEIAQGLAYAHSRGVMHRDIKPANVLLSAEARPKLADFNVSYNGGRADENPEDTFGGSLAYMSPEQLEACHPLLGGSPRSVRETSDVYAVGVMLWELLTGRRPFRDEQLPAEGGGSLVRLQRMIDARVQADFAQLAEQLPTNCPVSLRNVLIKCIQPNRADRYQTADELARALKLCLNPRAWSLLQTPQDRLGRFVLSHPVLAVVIAVLAPNIVIAAFNFIYNETRMSMSEALWERFWTVQWWVNGIVFPLGTAAGAWFAVRALSPLRDQNLTDPIRASTRLLKLAQVLSLMVVALWAGSGIAFPIAIEWTEGVGDPTGFYAHFFLSLALCGIAATAYPYMLVSGLAVRYLAPSMIRRGMIAGPRRCDLEETARWNRGMLYASVLTPMLGVLLVVLFGDRTDWALIAVSGGGLAGFAALAVMERAIGFDIDALCDLATEERRNSGGRGSSLGRSGGGSRRGSRH